MLTRVTNLNTTENLINQIFDRRESLDKVRQEIASGIKVEKASEDPGKAGSILNLQATSFRIDKHKERISYATGILNHQDATLSTADDVMTRAAELAEQGANEALSFSDRKLLSDEVFQLRDTMVSLANTTYQGKYIYGQSDDDDPPFDGDQNYAQAPTLTTDPAYVHYHFDNETGTGLTRNVQITDSDTVRVVSSGDTVFTNSINALERLGRALAGYKTSLNGSGAPDLNGLAYNQATEYHVQTADILSDLDAIKSARTNDIVRERSSVGSRINRLDQVTEILSTLKESTESSRSTLQDADIFDAATRFSNLQTSLQALLASGAQINNLSLLNYI